jgi:hypothetical protein
MASEQPYAPPLTTARTWTTAKLVGNWLKLRHAIRRRL